jgi:hypothetical protein
MSERLNSKQIKRIRPLHRQAKRSKTATFTKRPFA